jgi:hypothetical protein
MNLARLSNWLDELARAQTRRSHFAALAADKNSSTVSDNWLFSSDIQQWVTDQTPLSSDEYLACLGELRAVFPSQWIETQLRQIWLGRGSIGEFSLRPPPNHRLSYHPVPILLSGTARGVGQLCEVIRLGRDLVTTKGLIRIQSLRGELPDFSQYLGRVFELEVLAAVQRASISPQILKSGPDLSMGMDGCYGMVA